MEAAAGGGGNNPWGGGPVARHGVRECSFNALNLMLPQRENEAQLECGNCRYSKNHVKTEPPPGGKEAWLGSRRAGAAVRGAVRNKGTVGWLGGGVGTMMDHPAAIICCHSCSTPGMAPAGVSRRMA